MEDFRDCVYQCDALDLLNLCKRQFCAASEKDSEESLLDQLFVTRYSSPLWEWS